MTNASIKKDCFNLEERTETFSENLISFCKNVSQNSITIPIISQLVRAGTSIGANYCEADNAESRKDFGHKIGICKKETKETKYWLRTIASTLNESDNKEECRKLWLEAKELNLIFCAIVNSLKKSDEKF